MPPLLRVEHSQGSSRALCDLALAGVLCSALQGTGMYAGRGLGSIAPCMAHAKPKEAFCFAWHKRRIVFPQRHCIVFPHAHRHAVPCSLPHPKLRLSNAVACCVAAQHLGWHDMNQQHSACGLAPLAIAMKVG